MNIYPIFDNLLNKQNKQQLLQQNAVVVWLTGLSGSGKSTIINQTERILYQKGFITQVLDGDNLRTGINANLGFSEHERTENIRRTAEIAKLFCNNGIITLCSLVSPTLEIREMAKQIIGNQNFLEVYINAPLNVCEQRDVKGLYAKARQGLIKNFTGIDAPFEIPKNPSLEIKTDKTSIFETSQILVNFLLPLITYKLK